MPRIVPVFALRSAAAAVVLALAACGSDATQVAESAPTVVTGESSTTAGSTTEPTTTEPTTTEQATTTESPVEETTTTTESVDEVAMLCDAYLRYLVPSTVDAGVSQMTELLGADVPPGVSDALALLTSGTDDIEAFFEARASIEGYVRPICAARFIAGRTPASSAEDAATDFHSTVVAGNEEAARRFVADDVLVQFDWQGYPGATVNFSPDNDTFSMVLAPTVTVFCEVNNGIVDRCAFGE